jgi:hypothetical protein
MLTLHSERGSDRFQLGWTEEVNRPRVLSPFFTGKPWENLNAVEWCDKMLPSKRAELDLARVNLTAATATFGDLEDHPLAFMF